MTKLEKIILFVTAGIVVGLLFVVFTDKGNSVGGIYETNLKYFSGGIDVTNSGDIKVDGTTVIDASGNVDGAITTTSFTTSVFASTDATNLFNSGSASTTVQIGAASKAGCLILGDQADGASPVYIIATGSTITASTTKPAACQTVQ